jgi:type IV pilus assembly protein PilY1
MTDITRQVAASSDDTSCRRVVEYYALNSTEFFIGAYSSTNYRYGAGARFLNVTIPKGATISAAKLQLCGRSLDTGTDVNGEISGEKAVNPLTFSTVADFKDRRDNHRTTAIVDWKIIPAVVVDRWDDSPDISTIIQELVDQETWASGNAIVIFVDDYSDYTTHNNDRLREWRSYDSDSAKAPKLLVTYTTNYAPSLTTPTITDVVRD